jgi:hypothetical protein
MAYTRQDDSLIRSLAAATDPLAAAERMAGLVGAQAHAQADLTRAQSRQTNVIPILSDRLAAYQALQATTWGSTAWKNAMATYLALPGVDQDALNHSPDPATTAALIGGINDDATKAQAQYDAATAAIAAETADQTAKAAQLTAARARIAA